MRYSLTPFRSRRRVTTTSPRALLRPLAEVLVLSGRELDVRHMEVDLGERQRRPRLAAVEDDVFHLLSAEALRALLAEHPADGVGDVALSAAVRADDGRHPLVEGELDLVPETLESADIESFELHACSSGESSTGVPRATIGGGIPSLQPQSVVRWCLLDACANLRSRFVFRRACCASSIATF